jgi:hypothetical protein
MLLMVGILGFAKRDFENQLLFSNFVLSAATALESNLGRGIAGVGIVFVCVVTVFCCGTSASGKLISTSRKHSLPQHRME